MSPRRSLCVWFLANSTRKHGVSQFAHKATTAIRAFVVMARYQQLMYCVQKKARVVVFVIGAVVVLTPCVFFINWSHYLCGVTMSTCAHKVTEKIDRIQINT
jgi:hypothetical protein